MRLRGKGLSINFVAGRNLSRVIRKYPRRREGTTLILARDFATSQKLSRGCDLSYGLRDTRRTYFVHNTKNNPCIVTAELGCRGSIDISGKGRKQAKEIRGMLIHRSELLPQGNDRNHIRRRFWGISGGGGKDILRTMERGIGLRHDEWSDDESRGVQLGLSRVLDWVMGMVILEESGFDRSPVHIDGVPVESACCVKLSHELSIRRIGAVRGKSKATPISEQLYKAAGSSYSFWISQARHGRV
jgi:hypothetical protein